MRKMTAILGLVLISSTVFTAAPAFARDSAHLVCAGYMKQTKYVDPDNYGISIIFDEARSGADTRAETLSSVFAGELYQGIKADSNWGDKQEIMIAAKDDAKKVFFKGQYQVVSNNKTGKSQLKLDGQINLVADGSAGETISTTLKCVDISN